MDTATLTSTTAPSFSGRNDAAGTPATVVLAVMGAALLGALIGAAPV
jgi:hypothetical protein